MYTVTHIASGKTAVTGEVTVTVAILKVPPVVNDISVTNGNLRFIDFTFADNQQSRDAIYSITIIHDLVTAEALTYLQIQAGRIFSNYAGYGNNGEWTWTFKATGYQNAILKVEITDF